MMGHPNPYCIEACLDEIKYLVECKGYNPFVLMGRFIVRAQQDLFFNKNMILAMHEYFKLREIRWDDKRWQK